MYFQVHSNVERSGNLFSTGGAALTLHLIFPSSRMFLAAKSRWTNPLFERYFMPSATSRQNWSNRWGSSAHCVLWRLMQVASQRISTYIALHMSSCTIWKQVPVFKQNTVTKLTTQTIQQCCLTNWIWRIREFLFQTRAQLINKCVHTPCTMQHVVPLSINHTYMILRR